MPRRSNAECGRSNQLELPFILDQALVDDATRKRASEDMRLAAHRIAATATVIEGDGFGASAFRAAYATVNFLARTRHPTKVVRELDDAAAFLCDELGYDASSARALGDAARQASEKLRAYTP